MPKQSLGSFMWKCRHCGEQIEEDFDVCWNCQYEKNGAPPRIEKASGEEVSRPNPALETDGERSFAWFFCILYLALLGFVAAAITILVISTYLKEIPTGLGFLLPLLIFGLLPHAAKIVVQVLTLTRGIAPIKRLGKMIAAIHS
jgi:hypothetical protein